MSNTDSFIEEVTEEVRRDRLFATFRKYAWVAVAVVVLIVGGAIFNETRKAERKAAAEETGDAIFAAVEANDNATRIAELDALVPASPDAQMVVDFLLSSHQVIEGQYDDAARTLDTVANSADSDMPEIYRQIALFKSVTVQGANMPAEERRSVLEALAAPGAPLSLMAQEQLAILDAEEGNVSGAIDRLQAIVVDNGVTPGLRQRATQLIVALGGEPVLPQAQAATE